MSYKLLVLLIVFWLDLYRVIAVGLSDPVEHLRQYGANWGIWVDNGLVNPGEMVRMTVSVPLETPDTNLPTAFEVHIRYLEDTHPLIRTIGLQWNKSPSEDVWTAQVQYQPKEVGNYYASIQFYGHELFSHFAAWKPGITAINLWVQMPAEYHNRGDLDDLYLPEDRLGHLPIDYELVLVGQKVFDKYWPSRELFRQAQVEVGAEVIPFFDGGYFFKLAPEFTKAFQRVNTKLPDDVRGLISKESLAFHDALLPDPTFDSLSVAQCSSVIAGARGYWKSWGFRPFSGIATYSPSDALLESCRQNGIAWMSGVFPDYDFTDGNDRWQGGWIQKHHGMPSFPYLVSQADFRCAGKADSQWTMIFPGMQDLPVWDHENRHEHGTDPGFYSGYSGLSPAQRMTLYSKVFERDNKLADNTFPLAETFCIQMNNRDNHGVLKALIDTSRQGNLIFIHKRYLRKYFEEHHIDVSPDITYMIPDHKFTEGVPSNHPAPFAFSNEVVWEGADGKAAFISGQTAPLARGRSVCLPVWWYDYRNVTSCSPEENLPQTDLSSVTLKVYRGDRGPYLVVQSPKTFDGLPICLWAMNAGQNQSDAWIKRNRALRVAAPESMGANTFMWIIRPTIQFGKTVIDLYE